MSFKRNEIATKKAKYLNKYSKFQNKLPIKLEQNLNKTKTKTKTETETETETEITTKTNGQLFKF